MSIAETSVGLGRSFFWPGSVLSSISTSLPKEASDVAPAQLQSSASLDCGTAALHVPGRSTLSDASTVQQAVTSAKYLKAPAAVAGQGQPTVVHLKTPKATPKAYSKTAPLIASIKEKYRITKPGSGKNTQHIVIDLKDSGLKYQCGDSLGIFPSNNPLVVSRTIFALGSQPNVVLTKEKKTLEEVLSKSLNISRVTSALAKYVLDKNVAAGANNAALQELKAVASDAPKLTKYLENFEVWDFLQKHNSARLDPNEACSKLGALLPRLYSISSAQSKVGSEVHLSVAVVEYSTGGQDRYGVCTNYLCTRMPAGEESIPIYVQESDFKPPADPSVPMIMIGPGTGIAPFRAFLQEREVTGAPGPNWLFFGEWNRATDFFYEDYWKELEKKGMLRVDAAFSRDQKKKIYVQDLMVERGAELWQWLEKGAAVFVCGDAARMAKDVDKALHKVIEVHGKRTPKEARQYVKKMRQGHRYQRDIY